MFAARTCSAHGLNLRRHVAATGRLYRNIMAAAQPTAEPAATAPLFDKAAFNQTVQVPALRVPAQKCSDLMKRLRGYTFERPKVKCVIHDPQQQDMRLLLMREGLTAQDLPEQLQQLVSEDGLQWTQHDVQLDYSHLGAEEVLKRLLPEGVEVPTSFEMVGHIAHLNLREEQLPYKALIGAVIVDKNPQLKTVINKLGSIENDFRVFQMEVLAGEAVFETEVKQHGARFKLDFSQVYWNSRLETEHHRLVALFRPGDVVVDIMGGVGPFAIPAGLAGCTVYANDLNPSSAKYLAANIHLNKVAGRVAPFNMDGRQFVRLLLDTPGGPAQQARQQAAEAAAAAADTGGGAVSAQGAGAGASNGSGPVPQHGAEPTSTSTTQQPPKQQQQQQQRRSSSKQQKRPPVEVPPPWPPGFAPPAGGLHFQHAIMNLPASAVEFLDAFHGACDPDSWQGQELPWVHCYTFMKNETEQDVVRRVEAALGGQLDAAPQIHTVRDVAPNKLMLCVSFRVPAGVAFAGRVGAAHTAAAAAAGGTPGVTEQPSQLQQQQASKKPRLDS